MTAYKILTGNHPVPSKKDARTFDPIPEEKCIEDLTLKIVTHPLISPGALILIKALGTDRIYDVSTLRSHALTKAYFKSDQEWDEAFNEIKKARLVVVSDDEGVVLTRLGRYVWSVFLGTTDPETIRPPRLAGVPVGSKTLRHITPSRVTGSAKTSTSGTRRFALTCTLSVANGPLASFTRHLTEEARVSGSYASSMQFMRHGMTFYVVGPTTASVERAKQVAFQWAASKLLRRELVMHFATVQDVLNDREETVHLKPRKKAD